jgi:hypothetical protein
MTTKRKTERGSETFKNRITKMAVKAARLQRRKARLARARKALRNFEAGLITKTELRRNVPRRWLAG